MIVIVLVILIGFLFLPPSESPCLRGFPVTLLRGGLLFVYNTMMGALQKKYYICHISLIVTLAVISGCAGRGHAGGGAPSPPPQPPYRPPVAVTPAELPRPAAPTIRIGLKSDSKTIAIAGTGRTAFNDGFKASSVDGGLTVRLSFVPASSSNYFVQLGSYSSRQNAEAARSEFRNKSDQPSGIFENADLHKFQLRAGPYSSPEKAQQVIDDVKAKGYTGAFYVAENSIAAKMPDLLVANDGGETILKTKQPVQFWSADGTITVDGVLYRGYASVFVNAAGRLTAVNVVNFEDYLKGVVPNEIGSASPSTYEALKAQAVAARTYAYKNLKQFDSDGYDICATPRCQVYSGKSTENDLTSKAVEETRGEVITYQGEPINALYTSTCGGRTENAEYMFDGWNFPYLKSVECLPEENGISQKAVQISGQSSPWWMAWIVLKTSQSLPGSMQEPVTSEEAVSTFGSVLGYLGKSSCDPQIPRDTSWIGIGQFLMNGLCWQAKQEALLSAKDYQYFLSHLDFSLNPLPETHPFLFLFHEGVMTPADLSHFNPYLPMTRAEYFQALFKILQHYHQVNSTDGQIRDLDDHSIQVVDDLGVHTLPFDDSLFVYQKVGDNITPRSPVACSRGDDIHYALNGGKIAILVCELNQAGVSLDRSSKYTFWQEDVDPVELGRRVSKYLDVGDVTDLQPLSYGVSKRVYEMKVTGTKNSGVLKGLRVRWALGLKDNLFDIDRTYGADGKVKQFVFTGRGWGHGVGMCQVGALGYAKQGKDYRYILQHYYTGVQITKSY